MTALVALLTVVMVLLVILVAGLLRSHAEILRRLHELGAGEDLDTRTSGLPAPVRRGTGLGEVAIEAITGSTPSGGAASIPLKGTRGITLVAFLTTGCTTCRAFWGAPADDDALARSDLRTVIVTKGSEEESPGSVRNLNTHDATVVMSTETWDAFRIPVAPYFVLVDGSSGTILGEGAGASWPQVADLVGRALADLTPASSNGATIPSRSTADRLRDTDEELRRAGIEPGDATLYRSPGDGAPR